MAAELLGSVRRVQMCSHSFSGAPLRVSLPSSVRRAPVVPVRMAQSVQGKVVSTKMEKTVVVEVNRYPPHPLYKKRVRRTKRYIAHDGEQISGVGDTVQLDPCRPLSRHKAYTVAKVLIKSDV